MTGFQALLKIAQFNKIRRKSWKPGVYIYRDKKDLKAHLSTDNSLYKTAPDDLKANDWEIFLDSNS